MGHSKRKSNSKQLSVVTDLVQVAEFYRVRGESLQAAKKQMRPFPQGLKPVERQAPYVGAKAPTPKCWDFNTEIF